MYVYVYMCVNVCVRARVRVLASEYMCVSARANVNVSHYTMASLLITSERVIEKNFCIEIIVKTIKSR